MPTPKHVEDKLPLRQVISLCSSNFSQAIMFTLPFTVAVFMVRDFEAKAHDGDEQQVDEQTVGRLTGLLAGVFSFSSCITAYAWGCASNYIGRKPVIIIGNIVNCSSLLWYGLSASYGSALGARFYGGFLNGILGAWKCMISESVGGLAQGRFFGAMSLAWGLGAIVGPAMGGVLSRPCRMHGMPLCGDGQLLLERPYFLPCLVGCVVTAVSVALSIFVLKETLPEELRGRDPISLLKRWRRRRRRRAAKAAAAAAAAAARSHGDDACGAAAAAHGPEQSAEGLGAGRPQDSQQLLQPGAPRSDAPAGGPAAAAKDAPSGPGAGDKERAAAYHDSDASSDTGSDDEDSGDSTARRSAPTPAPMLGQTPRSGSMVRMRQLFRLASSRVYISPTLNPFRRSGSWRFGRGSSGRQQPATPLGTMGSGCGGCVQFAPLGSGRFGDEEAALLRPASSRRSEAEAAALLASPQGSARPHQAPHEASHAQPAPGPAASSCGGDGTGSSSSGEPARHQGGEKRATDPGGDAGSGSTSDCGSTPLLPKSAINSSIESLHSLAAVAAGEGAGGQAQPLQDAAGAAEEAAESERRPLLLGAGCVTDSSDRAAGAGNDGTGVSLTPCTAPAGTSSCTEGDGARSCRCWPCNCGGGVDGSGGHAPRPGATSEAALERNGEPPDAVAAIMPCCGCCKGSPGKVAEAEPGGKPGAAADKAGGLSLDVRAGHGGPPAGELGGEAGSAKPPLLPWYRYRQIVLTVLAYGCTCLLFCSVDETFPLFAAAPKSSGGLGMSEEQIAPPLMVYGLILMPYSLWGYPYLQRRMGTLRLARIGLVTAVGVCLAIPLTGNLQAVSWALAMVNLYGTMVVKAVAQCSAFTGSIIAVNAAPAPEQLGAVNGVGQTLAALVRGIGPAMGGLLWAASLDVHVKGLHHYLAFAIISLISVGNYLLLRGVHLPSLP